MTITSTAPRNVPRHEARLRRYLLLDRPPQRSGPRPCRRQGNQPDPPQPGIVTAQEVLSEVLTDFCAHGRHVRQTVAAFIRQILTDPAITAHPQSSQSFLSGLALYEARPDKEYSLTDCISMLVMRQEAITEVLTNDDHFKQEGFTILL